MTRAHGVEAARERPPVLGPLVSAVVTIRVLAAVKGEAEGANTAFDFRDPGSEEGRGPRLNGLVGAPQGESNAAELGSVPQSESQPYLSGQGGATVGIDSTDKAGGGVVAPLSEPVADAGVDPGVESSLAGGLGIDPPPAVAVTGGGIGGGGTTSSDTGSDREQAGDASWESDEKTAPEGPDQTPGVNPPDGPSEDAVTAGEDEYAGDKGTYDGFRLLGGPDDDFIVGDADDEVLAGSGGDDSLDGGMGDDTLEGGAGDDHLDGAGNDDRLQGGPGSDLLSGAEGDDVLYGGAGDDSLAGGAGADYLFGLDGDDTLIGGLGRDESTGSRGADRFVLDGIAGSPAERPDWILDFDAFQRDMIDVSPIDADGSTPEDDAFTFIGDNPFSGSAGELRFADQLGFGLLAGDIDGDGAADFGLALLGVSALMVDDIYL
jgi:Ca2+-binding RTX toxin-like protein